VINFERQVYRLTVTAAVSYAAFVILVKLVIHCFTMTVVFCRSFRI